MVSLIHCCSGPSIVGGTVNEKSSGTDGQNYPEGHSLFRGCNAFSGLTQPIVSSSHKQKGKLRWPELKTSIFSSASL